MHTILIGLQRFWRWRWYAKVLTLICALLMATGAIFWYLVGVNVYGRTHPKAAPPIAGITYVAESAIPSSVIDAQVKHIVDSLTPIVPFVYDAPLSPFTVFTETVPSSGKVARLMHCRLWCSCRTDLPPGSFQLLVFQLFPTAQSYTLVADTVMRYEDYVKPFKLQTS